MVTKTGKPNSAASFLLNIFVEPSAGSAIISASIGPGRHRRFRPASGRPSPDPGPVHRSGQYVARAQSAWTGDEQDPGIQRASFSTEWDQ